MGKNFLLVESNGLVNAQKNNDREKKFQHETPLLLLKIHNRLFNFIVRIVLSDF
jgi:hypothetical protein